MDGKILYFLKRLAYFIPTLLGLVILVFFISRVIPGDPAALVAGETATAEQVKAIRTQLGFDQPLHVQLGIYLQQLVTGDLGKSLYSGRRVSQDLIYRFPATLDLTLAAMFISVVIGIPLGILSALKRNLLLDHLVRGFTVSGARHCQFLARNHAPALCQHVARAHASWQPYRSS
jgi:peptide/nickel transport system permease protein